MVAYHLHCIKQLKIYINGVEKDSQSVGGPTGEAISNFVLGDFEDPISGRCWQGKIDDIRIYKRALSEGEVKALYDYEMNLTIDFPLPVEGLFAFYPFYRKLNWAITISFAKNNSRLYV